MGGTAGNRLSPPLPKKTNPTPGAAPPRPSPELGVLRQSNSAPAASSRPGATPGASSAIKAQRGEGRGVGGTHRRPGCSGTLPAQVVGKPGTRHTPSPCLSVPAPGPASQGWLHSLQGTAATGRVGARLSPPFPKKKGEVKEAGRVVAASPHARTDPRKKGKVPAHPPPRELGLAPPPHPLHGTPPGGVALTTRFALHRFPPRPGHRSRTAPAPPPGWMGKEGAGEGAARGVVGAAPRLHPLCPEAAVPAPVHAVTTARHHTVL